MSLCPVWPMRPSPHQGPRTGALPALRTWRAEASASLVVASTATGKVKQQGAQLALLVWTARSQDLRAGPMDQEAAELSRRDTHGAAEDIKKNLRAPARFSLATY